MTIAEPLVHPIIRLNIDSPTPANLSVLADYLLEEGILNGDTLNWKNNPNLDCNNSIYIEDLISAHALLWLQCFYLPLEYEVSLVSDKGIEVNYRPFQRNRLNETSFVYYRDKEVANKYTIDFPEATSNSEDFVRHIRLYFHDRTVLDAKLASYSFRITSGITPRIAPLSLVVTNDILDRQSLYNRILRKI